MGNNSDPNYIAGRDGLTHFAVTDQAEYRRGLDEREGRNRPAFGGGGGGAGFPVFFLAFIPILIAAGYVVAVPLFPVAGLITLAIGFSTAFFLGVDFSDAGLNHGVVVVLICIPIYLIALLPERRAARFPRYRVARHWVRVVGLAFALNEALLPTLAMWVTDSDSTQYVAWGIVAGGLTLLKLVRLAILMVAVHVGFRWLETKGRAMDPARRFGLRAPV